MDRTESAIHTDCFYNLINGCADKHHVTGRVAFNAQGSYVLTIDGPVAAISDFIAVLRFMDGTVGKIVLIKTEDAVVPQRSRYFHDVPDDHSDLEGSSQDEGDAVVPVHQGDTVSTYIYRLLPLCRLLGFVAIFAGIALLNILSTLPFATLAVKPRYAWGYRYINPCLHIDRSNFVAGSRFTYV